MKTTPNVSTLIYDVGMNTGQDTDYYLKRGFNVVAFEADPNNVGFCRQRFADEIENGRLKIVEGAITENRTSGGFPEKVKFYQNMDHPLWGSTSEDFAARNEVLGTTNNVIEVDAVDFRECLEEYGIPYYLKADIVGDEILCLRALREFQNKPEYISIRSEKVIFKKLKKEFKLLEELGYDRFKAVQQDVTDWHINFQDLPGVSIDYIFEEGASGPFGEDSPGDWKKKDDVINEYRRIFKFYWLFGDYSYLIQTEKGKEFIAQLERFARRPLPGWYDTHAKHSSALD
ncbi:MAG: FkbM family methyltransferase [Acidobacteria bacterium]|nr:FkbM family methyltransferase [Acidobacteriota bacterium]